MITEFEKYLIERTIDFYNGNTDAYLEYLDDNAVWYGPRRGQVLVGKAAIAEHLENLELDPRLFIENITTRLVFCTNSTYLVIMNYRVCVRRGGGAIDVVKYLLTKGLNINELNDAGRTPLFFAREHHELRKFMLSHGAK